MNNLIFLKVNSLPGYINMKPYVLVVVLLLSVFQSAGYAAELFGRIVKYEGTVKLLRQDKEEPVFVDSGDFPVYLDDKIHTGNNSKAFIRLTDNSKMIVLSNTKLAVREIKLVGISIGKVIVNIVRKNIL